MRTKLRSRLSLLFMTFALVLAIPAMALACSVDVAVVDVTEPNARWTLTASQPPRMCLRTTGGCRRAAASGGVPAIRCCWRLELLRTPSKRSSENAPSTHSGE